MEVILRSVGVGQTQYAVRALVDNVILLSIREAGDQIQMMKDGLEGTAEINFVSRADLPSASAVAEE